MLYCGRLSFSTSENPILMFESLLVSLFLPYPVVECLLFYLHYSVKLKKMVCCFFQIFLNSSVILIGVDAYPWQKLTLKLWLSVPSLIITISSKVNFPLSLGWNFAFLFSNLLSFFIFVFVIGEVAQIMSKFRQNRR